MGKDLDCSLLGKFCTLEISHEMSQCRHLSPTRWYVLTGGDAHGTPCSKSQEVFYPGVIAQRFVNAFLLPSLTENMNYTNGFPCPSKVQTDFVGHSAHSTWNSPAGDPTAWEHTSFVNSPVSVSAALPSLFSSLLLFLAPSSSEFSSGRAGGVHAQEQWQHHEASV